MATVPLALPEVRLQSIGVEVSGSPEAGSANFAVMARAQIDAGGDATRFTSFDFVTRDEEFPESGYFPIQGLPLAGQPAVVRALVTPRPATAVFRVIDENGNTLQTLALTNDSPDAKPDFFRGTVSLPAVPFTIVVNGTDAFGAPFQRQWSSTFRTQTVSVGFAGPDLPILPGSGRQVAFVVKNLGEATATFGLTAVTKLGVARDLSPGSVSHRPGCIGRSEFLRRHSSRCASRQHHRAEGHGGEYARRCPLQQQLDDAQRG